MKILITGATGFLGSHLTKELVKEGYEVILLKRSFSNTWRISDILSKVTVFNIDQCPIEQPFIECGPIDVVIHTATMYDRKNERPSQLLNANVSFPLQLLETAISFQTKAFINTDSFIHKNNVGYSHLAGYALTKKQFLEWGKELSTVKNIRFINVRLEHLYGSFDSESKFCAHIIKSSLNNVPELPLTEGNQKRDFIHINDAVSAYSLLLKQRWSDFPSFKEYELGTGRMITVRHFIEIVQSLSQSKTKLLFGSLPQRDNEIMESKANIEELKKLGWTNKITVEKGIELTIKDEKNQKIDDITD